MSVLNRNEGVEGREDFKWQDDIGMGAVHQLMDSTHFLVSFASDGNKRGVIDSLQ